MTVPATNFLGRSLYVTFSPIAYSGRRASVPEATSAATLLLGSSRSPKTSAPLGHDSTQRGSGSPLSSRCAHRVHFWASWSSSFHSIWRYGHRATRPLLPLAFSGSISTMPSARR